MFGGLKTKKPGLKVRLTQALSDMIKKDLLNYGTAYLNFDIKWPETGIYSVKFFPFYFDFTWFNLRTDPLLVNVDRFAFNFTKMAKDNTDVVFVEIPVVESWRVYFDYDFWYIFHFTGQMSIEFSNLQAVLAVTMKATEQGHLYP